MNWKGRQMFGGGPSGIVQMMGGGMTPYPTHTMPNGNVMRGATHGGYQGGGITGPAAPTESSMEQRIAQIAAQQGISVPEMKVQILQKTATDQGLQLPPKVIQQYSVGLISLQDALAQGTPAMQTGSMGAMPMQQPNAQIQMQAGGMVGAELFEEGDSDINNALNTMASVSNPEVPDMPASNGMVMPGEKMNGEKATMDQGLESLDPSLQKMPFQKMAVNIVKQADELLAQEDYANIKEIEQQVLEQLNAIDAQYRLQTGAKDSILTEEFLAVLDNLTTNSQSNFDEVPAYSDGGLHLTPDQELELLIRNLGGGTSADPEKMQEIIAKYRSKNAGSSEMLEKQIAKARRGALLGGKTKQSGLSGLLDVMGQADVAEATALGELPKQLSANEAALERMAMENELAMYGGSKGTGTTAEGKNLLILQQIISMPEGTAKDMYLDRFNVDTRTKTVSSIAIKRQAEMAKEDPKKLAKWKRANGFEGKSIAYIAVVQANELVDQLSKKVEASEVPDSDSNELD